MPPSYSCEHVVTKPQSMCDQENHSGWRTGWYFLEQSNNKREFMITEESNLCMVGKSEGINESNFDWKT